MWSNATMTDRRAHYLSACLRRRGCPLTTVIAFIDGTCRPCCRPKRHQRSVYNGWKRKHLLKFSCVVSPDGMIASCCGPFAGRRNDRYMLTASNIKAHFQANLPNWSLFGDAGYVADYPFLFRGYPGRYPSGSPQARFNKRMSRLRE